MQLIAEETFVNAADPMKIPVPANFTVLRVLIAGELEAQNTDQRCLFTFNDIAAGYKSFINFFGDGGGGEWEDKGFYVGRNAFALNSELFAEYTLTTRIISNRVLGFGAATFTLADGRVMGYRGHGRLNSNAVLASLVFACSGGIFTGNVRILGA